MGRTGHLPAGAIVTDAPVPSSGPSAGSARRIVVGIGEWAVSSDADAAVITHALGSCVAVCIWDPAVSVAGLIHVLLPDSRINPERAKAQPAAFADTGIPLLFHAAYARGLDKKRARVRLVGGASVAGIPPSEAAVGKRNVLAARSLLWKNGVMIDREIVGGTEARTVTLQVADGRMRIGSGSRWTEED